MTPGNTPPVFPAFPPGLPLRQSGGTGETAALENAFLEAVQGNILKGHGREHLRLVFLRFTGPTERTRQFLRAAASGTGNPDGIQWVTSAADQVRQAGIRHVAWRANLLLSAPERRMSLLEQEVLKGSIRTADTQLFGSLLLTRAGLRTLGVALEDAAFARGMQGRMGGLPATDEMGATPYSWEDTVADFHAVFLLACDHPAALENHQAGLISWGRAYGVEPCHASEQGFTWRMPGDPYGTGYCPPREPFGFADGLSQPRFFADERLNQPTQPDRPPAWAWTDLRLQDVFISEGEHAGGSFVALLKIEQKVATFRRHEEEIARLLIRELGVAPGIAAYLAPAVLMGRTRQGYPLGEVLGRLQPDEAGLRSLFSPDGRVPNPAGPPLAPPWLNEFDFERQAAASDAMPGARGCPFHVHLRKMNPRIDDPAGIGSQRTLVRAQPVRRGAAYDPQGLLTRKENGGSTAWPDEGTGLLFLAYMSDLAVQFEQAHTHWAPDTAFPGPGGADPVLSQPAGPLKFGPVELPALPRVLKRLGGVYLYAPSLLWLQQGGTPAISSR